MQLVVATLLAHYSELDVSAPPRYLIGRSP